MKRLLALVLALTGCIATWAQEQAIRPLDVPMSFSGTYGELRHDHFHSGVDWRVGGKVGDDIHAIKSGYVSRESPSGKNRQFSDSAAGSAACWPE